MKTVQFEGDTKAIFLRDMMEEPVQLNKDGTAELTDEAAEHLVETHEHVSFIQEEMNFNLEVENDG